MNDDTFLTKKKLAILLKINTALLLSLLLLSLFCSNSIIQVNTNSDIERSTHQISIISQDQKSSTNTLSKDIVVFFSSHNDYLRFLKNENQFNIKNMYSSLDALKFGYNVDLVNSLSKYQISGIFPANTFNAKYTIPSSQSYENSGNLGLDAFDYTIGQQLNLTDLWNAGSNGTGVVVGVIDNGIEFNHPLLSGKDLAVVSNYTLGATACKNHGTYVGGAIAATGNQTADLIGTGFGSKLIDIQVGCDGTGGIIGDFLGAFNYILEQNATIDVINTSWGGDAPAWDLIIEKLESAGIITVGSAGNDAGFQTATTGGPGNSLYGISVGAVDKNGDFWPYSSQGPAIDMLYKPDLLAWGANINLPNSDLGINSMSGTSFSSPFVAGGIATLISALENQSIQWNPGLIKASLLQTANSIGDNEFAYGQGIANFGKAYTSILNAERDVSDLPYAIYMTPKNMSSNKYLTTVPQGMQLNIPLTLVTSHPDNISISYTGDFVGTTTYDPLESTFSQKLNLIVNTTKLTPNSVVNGSVVATVGNYTIERVISFQLTDPAKGVIGIDLYHTFWDQYGYDEIGGSQTGEMIRLAMDMGYTVKEIDYELDNTVLQSLDILWIPDSSNYVDPAYNATEYEFTGAEIQAIHDFVANGKSLFVDFYGLLDDESLGTPPNSYYGSTNPALINPLISQFGISANEAAITKPGSSTTFVLLNESSLVGSANKQTHFGNYLTVNNTWQAISVDGNQRISTAAYTDPLSGGRVVVTSTNYWLSNKGLNGGYYGAGQDNKIFAGNTINWLSQSTRMGKLASEITDNWISGEFIVLTNGTPEPTTPDAFLLTNGVKSNISLVNLGNGHYKFNVSTPGSAHFGVIVEMNSDYLGWNNIVDFEGPIISVSDNNPENTIFDKKSLYILEFYANDETSEVDTSSLSIKLNGTKLSISQYSIEASEIPQIQGYIIKVFLQGNDIDTTNYLTSYVLELTVLDYLANARSLTYHFSILNPDGINKPASTTPSQPTTPTESSKKNIFFDFLQGNLAGPVALLFGLAIFALAIENFRVRRKK